jgi:hypothetical protein
MGGHCNNRKHSKAFDDTYSLHGFGFARKICIIGKHMERMWGSSTECRKNILKRKSSHGITSTAAYRKLLGQQDWQRDSTGVQKKCVQMGRKSNR